MTKLLPTSSFLELAQVTIRSFQISDYKSFFQSQSVLLGRGFTVVVGQNNSGKTALLEGLSMALGLRPHLSLRTRPERNIPITGRSSVTIRFELTGPELWDILREIHRFYLPLGQHQRPETAAREFAGSMANGTTLEATYDASQQAFTSVSMGAFWRSPESGTAFVTLVTADRKANVLTPDGQSIQIDWRSVLPVALATVLRNRVYMFQAERLNVGEYQINSDANLARNAGNLAQVLHFLQTSNTPKWQRYLAAVRTVLPQIVRITVPPSGSTARILVWSFAGADESERDDLAVTLADSGTGIGQVLAILYIVLTSEFPRTILIDEPQSFLHPGAVRKLFEVLRQFPIHQYVISTHSAAAIAAADPQTLLLVRNEAGESVVDVLNPTDADDIGRTLANVGARLSDVFGSDNVLWVEGPTEERCIPIIMRYMSLPVMATSVVGVLDTGSFARRTAKVTFGLYRRLSAGSALVPPALGFLFDREGRTERERADMIRESRNRVRFTQRRMYENYLLQPQAIAYVLTAVAVRTTPEDIHSWIENCRAAEEMFDSSRHQELPSCTSWFEEVHGANCLSQLFSTFSNGTVEYDKIEHGVALTRWLCENTFAEFEEISAIIRDLFQTLASA